MKIKSLDLPETTLPCALNVSDCCEKNTSKSNANSLDTNVPFQKYSISANDEATVVQPGESAIVGHSKNTQLDTLSAAEPSTDIAFNCAVAKNTKGMSKKQKKKLQVANVAAVTTYTKINTRGVANNSKVSENRNTAAGRK